MTLDQFTELFAPVSTSIGVPRGDVTAAGRPVLLGDPSRAAQVQQHACCVLRVSPPFPCHIAARRRFNDCWRRSALQHVAACKLCGICVLVRDFFIRDHVWSCGVSSCGLLIDCKHLTGNSLFYKSVKRAVLIFSQELPSCRIITGGRLPHANLSADDTWQRLFFMLFLLFHVT